MPYQVFGCRSGAASVTVTCTRSASVRSSGCHLGDRLEDRVQTVGLLRALPAFGAQFGGARLHRGALGGAEAVGRGLCGLRGHFLAPVHVCRRVCLSFKGYVPLCADASRFLISSHPDRAIDLCPVVRTVSPRPPTRQGRASRHRRRRPLRRGSERVDAQQHRVDRAELPRDGPREETGRRR